LQNQTAEIFRVWNSMVFPDAEISAVVANHYIPQQKRLKKWIGHVPLKHDGTSFNPCNYTLLQTDGQMTLSWQ